VDERQSGNSPEAARANLEAEGAAARSALVTADMTAAPFPDAAFDVALSSLAFHDIEHGHSWSPARPRALDEAVRVLKPGGRLVITDILRAEDYATYPKELGMTQVGQQPLGWQFWFARWFGASLVTARKPLT